MPKRAGRARCWPAPAPRSLTRPNELEAQRVTPSLLADYAVGFVAGREPGTGPAAAALVVVAVAGLGFAAAERPERIRLAVELGGIVLLTVLFLKLTNHWFELRYFWFAMAALARLVGEGLGAAARLGRFRVPAFVAGSALLLLAEMPALAENARSGRVDWRIPARYVVAHAKSGRGGPVVPADWWSYMLLYPQNLRWEIPFTLATPCLTSGELETVRARFPEGWIARAPFGGSELDESLKTGPKPWATFDRADGVSLYRFENGRIIPP